MPKLVVNKLKLMEPSQLTGLVGMSLHHISSVLEDTHYKSEISEVKIKDLNSISLEDALLKNFIKTLEELKKISTKDIRILLSALLTKFEVNCVKTLLRAKEAELSSKEAMNYILPVGILNEMKCRNILETSENISDVITALSDLEYGLVLKKAFTGYLKENAFYLLEVALDRHVYNKIWKASRKFWGLDRKIVKTIIGLEIDSINIKTILRCKTNGIDENQIKKYLIPASEVVTEKELHKAMRCSDMRSSIESLVESAKRAKAKDHSIIFKEFQELQIISLTAIEIILDRGLVEANIRMMKRYTPYFNIGLLLAFLYLKWFEIKNLRAIIIGAESGIAPDRVNELLIIPG
jgi:V/A-type H+-transporting ATPase subunit C